MQVCYPPVLEKKYASVIMYALDPSSGRCINIDIEVQIVVRDMYCCWSLSACPVLNNLAPRTREG